ncbi:MAG: MFS transporter [Ignavibacteriaceae bacterium]
MNFQQKNPSAKLILIITTLSAFMTAFMGSALNIALPIIGKDFNASALMLSWLSTIYLLTTAALLLPAGKLMDIYGRTKFFKYGVILFTLGSLLCGIAPNSIMLLLLRIIQGAGSAFIFSSSTAILVSAYPVSSRGKALGINTAAVYTGLSSGPFLGGLITYYWNWRGIFFITVFIGIALIILTYIYLKQEFHELSKQKYDYSGAGIYIFSIILLMVGISLFPRLIGFVLLAISLVIFILFYFYELRVNDPIFSASLFKENRTFTFSNLAALINYSATFAIGFLMSFYLQSVKGLTSQNAGLILMTQPIMQALFSPLAGKLSDKTEPQIVASIGMGLLTIGLIVFCFVNPGTSLALIITNLAMLGLGFALFSSPNVNAIMSSVEKTHYGVASSTLASMRMIGQMFSMGIVIIIFSIFIGGAKINIANQMAFLTSARYAFILFSLLSFLGIFASISRGKIHK